MGIGLIYGAFQKGAFYPKDFRTVFVLILLSGLTALLVGRSRPDRPTLAVLLGLLGIGVLASISASINGTIANALPTIALCLLTACVVYGCAALSASSRWLLAHLLMLVGLIVAVTSWAGVAFHRYPWALLSQTLWRGASTLTYANAAAASLFAPMVIAAIAYIQTRRKIYLITNWLLALGWVVTLSRAAGVSLFIALIVVLSRSRQRREILCLWPVVPATVIAFVALMPSLPEHDVARPTLAFAGVVVGVIALIALPKIRTKYTIAVLVVVAVIVIAVTGASAQTRTAISRIGSTRIDIQSSDRTDLLKVTFKQFKAHPVDGVGPGRINFVYVNRAGVTVEARFTHNEYLQLATEIGSGAFVFLALLFVGLVAGVRERSLEQVGGLIIVLSFAVHSALDFLWHIPEVTLIAVACACVLKAGVNFRPAETHSAKVTANSV